MKTFLKDQRHKNVLYSAALLIGLCLFVTFFKWDSDFAGSTIVVLTEIVAITGGALFLVLRLFNVQISKTNFIYTYFGVLNLFIGLLAIGFIAIHQNSSSTLIFLCLFQMIIGIYILIDVFRPEKNR
jgi:FtsH-binding integral membrane protein